MGVGARQQELWNEVTASFRDACILRREQHTAEADRLLHEVLPQRISAWSRASLVSATEQKTKLMTMFAEEQKRVDAALAIQQVLTEKLTRDFVPVLCTQVTEELRAAFETQLEALRTTLREVRPPAAAVPAPTSRPRIRFDDIPGVIDALLAEQQADYGPRPALQRAAA